MNIAHNLYRRMQLKDGRLMKEYIPCVIAYRLNFHLINPIVESLLVLDQFFNSLLDVDIEVLGILLFGLVIIIVMVGGCTVEVFVVHELFDK